MNDDPNQYRWRRADESDIFLCCPNAAERKVFYARIYTSGKRYSFSKTNQLITNLKKPINRPADELRYKNQAIEQFATEVAEFLGKYQTRTFSLVPVPPSKMHGHPEYDDRLDRVAQLAATKSPNVVFLPLLAGTLDRDAAHSSRSTARSVEAIFSSLTVDEAIAARYSRGSVLVVLDDVSTSGATFEAAYRKLADRFPHENIESRSSDCSETFSGQPLHSCSSVHPAINPRASTLATKLSHCLLWAPSRPGSARRSPSP